MKHINKSYIEKTYEEDYETITLYLEDTRDNYLEKDALGRIGTINISRGFLQAIPEDDLDNLEVKEDVIDEALEELFGTTDIDEFSDIYYEKIKGMITDKTIETLGYKARQKVDDINEYYNQKQSRRR